MPPDVAECAPQGTMDPEFRTTESTCTKVLETQGDVFLRCSAPFLMETFLKHPPEEEALLSTVAILCPIEKIEQM